MPYPFVLPTTSAFPLSAKYVSDSHPSLPLAASTHRGLVRDALKKHKRLSAAAQASHLTIVAAALRDYLPYLLVIADSLFPLSPTVGTGVQIATTGKAIPIEWRPTLSVASIPGKQVSRVKLQSFQDEVSFTLATLAHTCSLLARVALQPLYLTTNAPIGSDARVTAISNANRFLLDAASVYDCAATRAEQMLTYGTTPSCADVSVTTLRALCHVALAEATLLAVLKDDPYPAAVAQDRNMNDKEWMYKAPTLPKVRTHLFARLCVAASGHLSKAYSLCKPQSDRPKVDPAFVDYVEALGRTGRAKACRFFGIDAELGGQTGDALGWLGASHFEFDNDTKDPIKKESSTWGRFRKVRSEKAEDRRIEKGSAWGLDGGKIEEKRVIEMLESKWTKHNDTMFTQPVPKPLILLSQMPSGTELHNLKPFIPPILDESTMASMRAAPDRPETEYEDDDDLSSDDDPGVPSSKPIGAFPGTQKDYAGSSSYY